jgi:hypothetical protein
MLPFSVSAAVGRHSKTFVGGAGTFDELFGRLHLPMQLFTCMVARASRSGDPLLQNPPE